MKLGYLQQRAWMAWAALVCSALLAACAAPGTGSTSNRSSASSDAGTGRDLMTESDETETHKRARIRLELATAYFSQGQSTTALDEVKQALAVDPNLAGAYNLRGLIYASLNDDGLAEESFRRALQLSSDDGSSMHNYAWFMCQRRRFDEADAMFGRAAALPQYRNLGMTLMAQGVCQARAGKSADAEKTLLHAFEVDPSSPATAMNLADLLYRKGDYERARFYVRRVNNVPDLSNAETLWLAARIEQRMGNRQGANDLGAQLRARYPNSREAAAFDQGRFNE